MQKSQLTVTSLGMIALALAACSGGQNSFTPRAGATPAPKTSALRTAAVTVTLSIPKRAPAARRGRHYVSSSTLSASISVNGTPEIAFSTAAGSPGCTVDSSANVCTAMVDAPVGADTFVLSTFDGPISAGTTSGTLLSTGSAMQTIVSGTANAVNLTLAGAIAFIETSLNPDVVPAGVATTIPVIVEAFDADENVIVGPGSYVDETGNGVTIAVGDADASGTTALSTGQITAPGQTLNLSYSGTGLHGSVPLVTASATGFASSSASLSVTPTLQAFATLPRAPQGGITLGSDGNLYVLDANPDPVSTDYNFLVAQIKSNGAVQEFSYAYQPCPAPTTGSEGTTSGGGAIATGSDGSVYFAVPDECNPSNSDRLVGMTTGGAFSNAAFNIGQPTPAAYMAGGTQVGIAFSNGSAVLTEGTVTQSIPTPFPIATGPAFLSSTTAGTARYTTYAAGLALNAQQSFALTSNQIAIVSDGSAWFPGQIVTSPNGVPLTQVPTIVRSTTAGGMSSMNIPQPSGFTEVAKGVTTASDGNVWYVADRSPVASAAVVNELVVGNVTSDGVFSDFPVTDSNGDEFLYNSAIVDGLDNALYTLTTINGNGAPVYLARVTHAGVATVAPAQVIGAVLPTVGTFGYGVRGNDGNIYYDVNGTSLIKLVY